MSEGQRVIYSGPALRQPAPEDGLGACYRLVDGFGAPHRPVNAWPERPAFGGLMPLDCRHCGEPLGLVPTGVDGQDGPLTECGVCGRYSFHPGGTVAEDAPEPKKGRRGK